MLNNISLITMVKNEERRILKMLISVKDLVKEIVIVDTGSTDKTLEICREFAKHSTIRFKIIENPCDWSENIFTVNKQLALDNASEDWVLNLDADEVLSRELDAEVRKFVDQKESDCLVMNRVNFRKEKEDFYDCVVYLWRRSVDYKYIAHRPYHGTVSLMGTKFLYLGKRSQAKGYIYHFGWWDITEEEYQRKQQNYKSYPPFV